MTDWVLVPRVPTEAMIARGNAIDYGAPTHRPARMIYEGMIAAAPPAPPGTNAMIQTARNGLTALERASKIADPAAQQFQDDAIALAVRALERDPPEDGYSPSFGSDPAMTNDQSDDLADILRAALSPHPVAR